MRSVQHAGDNGHPDGLIVVSAGCVLAPTETGPGWPTDTAPSSCSKPRGVTTLDMLGRIRRLHDREKRSVPEITRITAHLRICAMRMSGSAWDTVIP